MVVAPTGEVTAALDLYREEILMADVGLLAGETFYARRGDWPLILLSLAWLALASWRARRA
jgi:apolipoprotein N-acyltransferase